MFLVLFIVLKGFCIPVTKPEKSNLKEEGFILVYVFRGFSSPWLEGIVEQINSFHGGQKAEKRGSQKGLGQDIAPKNTLPVTY
jgi:hypothetical protein